jgi:hypothetical protein
MIASTSDSWRRCRFSAVGLFGLALLFAGCGHELASRSADVSRKVSPIPACVHPLDPRGTPAPGLMRTLTPREYWQAAFSIEPEAPVQLTEETLDCRGEKILASRELAGAALTAEPLVPVGEEIVFGGGPDRLRIAWLRTHRTDQGGSGGPLIMIRSFEQHAEVYGVGVFRGSDKTRFIVQRSGDQALVLAKTDGCAGTPKGSPCETTLTVFQQRLGVLENVGEVMLERIAYAEGSERGVKGKIEYHLTAVPNFEGGGIRLHEQLSVVDSAGKEFRRGELDRYFDVRDGRVVAPAEPSLWDRFFVNAVSPSPGGDTTPPGETGTTTM